MADLDTDNVHDWMVSYFSVYLYCTRHGGLSSAV